MTISSPSLSTNSTGGAALSLAGVRCECDHLTDFVVVKAPSNWDEFMESTLAGFEVNVFSWEQACYLVYHSYALPGSSPPGCSHPYVTPGLSPPCNPHVNWLSSPAVITSVICWQVRVRVRVRVRLCDLLAGAFVHLPNEPQVIS